MLSDLPLIYYVQIFNYLFPTTTVGAFLTLFFFLVVVLVGAKRLKLNFPAAALMALLVFILSNVISRVIFILSRIYLHHDFESQGRVFYLFTNQKVSIGFLLAIILAVPIGRYVYDLKKGVGKYFDLIMLAYLSIFFSRLGGALVRYHPGRITDSNWGTFYLGHYRHEPSLYEAVSLLLIFALSILVVKRIKTEGLLGFIILAWVSFSRIITDFFRSNDLLSSHLSKTNGFLASNYHLENGLTLNQIFHTLLFLGAVFGMFILIKKTKYQKKKSLKKLN